MVRVVVLVVIALAPLAVLAARGEEPLAPLPSAPDEDAGRVALGRRLFHDAGLSRTGKISCATCHELKKGGVDGRAKSVGVNGTPVGRNAPTVLNAAHNFRQFWDGRAVTLEEQAEGPLLHPDEMGASWPAVIGYLTRDDAYTRAFKTSYGGVTREAVLSAIATYERTLVTPARFDRFLRGEPAALTDEEHAGYRLFKSYGCVGCHQGVNVGGNMFQTFGALLPPSLDEPDRGRFAITSDVDDDMVFRVPSLRNVALTAPYFHDGRAATLDEAVDTMARVQLGRPLPIEQRRLIVAFLGSLTAERLPEAP